MALDRRGAQLAPGPPGWDGALPSCVARERVTRPRSRPGSAVQTSCVTEADPLLRAAQHFLLDQDTTAVAVLVAVGGPGPAWDRLLVRV